jgi:hypothetical protein
MKVLEFQSVQFVKEGIRLQQSWFWPGMRSDVQLYCQSCRKCQTVNPGANMKPAPQEAMSTAAHFNAILCRFNWTFPAKQKQKQIPISHD